MKNSTNTMLLSSLLILIACNKPIEKCQTCNSTPTFSKLMQFEGAPLSLKLGFWKIGDRNVEHYYYSSYYGKSYSSFLDVKKYLSNNIILNKEVAELFTNENLYAITLFIRGDISGSNLIHNKNICGLNKYSIVNNKLYHSIYLINDGMLTEVKELRAEVDGIKINYIHDIALHYFFKEGESLTSMCLGVTDENFNIKLSKPNDELGDRLHVLFTKKPYDKNQITLKIQFVAPLAL